MPIERRPVLASYLLILVGFLLAVVVASVIYTPPTPSCNTAQCNASSIADLLGLAFMVIGLCYLGVVVSRPAASAPPSGTPPSPVYSFTGAPAPPTTPPEPGPALPTTPAPHPVRYCPACGAPVKTDFGFCPRCGQSIP